ncbi:MAG: phospholipid-binding protein MlaC [Sideroxydans sp.]
MRNILKHLLAWLLAGLLGLPTLAAQVDESTPDGMIMRTVNQVLDVLHKDPDIVNDPQRLNNLVDAIVLPHFDFTRMTQLAVGRPWRTATDEQKLALTTEFRDLLVRTYTKVFSIYVDPQVTVKSARLLNEKEATVHTEIRVPDGRVVAISYEMRKAAAGWQAFDVVVEGISLVTSYRNTFADEVQQGGIDGLIRSLKNKNQSALASGKPVKVNRN